MTLLEKLNLEPDAVGTRSQQGKILGEATANCDPKHAFGLIQHLTTEETETLTNAEFLTACEAWLANN